MLIKICAIVITGAVTALMLSELKGSFSFAVRIGALTVAIGAVIALAASAVTSVNGIIGDNESVSRYAFIILRALGVALIGNFTSLICRELGAESLCFAVELAARLEIFLLCVPLINEIIQGAIKILDM